MAAPFLLITGDNPPERQAQEAKALKAWLGDDPDHLGRHIFQGNETDSDTLLMALTPSLFASKSAVVIRGAEIFIRAIGGDSGPRGDGAPFFCCAHLAPFCSAHNVLL